MFSYVNYIFIFITLVHLLFYASRKYLRIENLGLYTYIYICAHTHTHTHTHAKNFEAYVKKKLQNM
jgi:hypothetical protein